MASVLVVTGSVRPNSVNEKVIPIVVAELEAQGATTTVADLKKLALPFYDAPVPPASPDFSPTHENVKAWTSQVAEADGVVFVTPEYNHTMSPLQLNAIDWIGNWAADPGSGWDVAGVSAATKDHTIVRKATVESGNAGDWFPSAGTTEEDSEWVVLDQNDWTYLGSHPHDFSPSIGECFDPEDYTAGDPCPGYTDEASCDSDDSCYWENDTDQCEYEGPPTCVWDCEGICEFTGDDENEDPIAFCTWMIATLVDGGCSSDCDVDTSTGLNDAVAQCELCVENGNPDSNDCDVWGDCDYNGDVTYDGAVNVQDVVVLVQYTTRST